MSGMMAVKRGKSTEQPRQFQVQLLLQPAPMSLGICSPSR